MNTVRTSSFDEFIEWYLNREKWKVRERKDEVICIPSDPNKRCDMMRQNSEWEDKIHNWFHTGTWSIVELTQNEFGRLIPAYFGWTCELIRTSRIRRHNRGLLRCMAREAIEKSHLNSDAGQAHREYYEKLKKQEFRLRGQHRIVLCSSGKAERKANPKGLYHLQDGWGRSLPYQILLLEKQLSYEAVEAFLALHPDESK